MLRSLTRIAQRVPARGFASAAAADGSASASKIPTLRGIFSWCGGWGVLGGGGCLILNQALGFAEYPDAPEYTVNKSDTASRNGETRWYINGGPFSGNPTVR